MVRSLLRSRLARIPFKDTLIPLNFADSGPVNPNAEYPEKSRYYRGYSEPCET